MSFPKAETGRRISAIEMNSMIAILSMMLMCINPGFGRVVRGLLRGGEASLNRRRSATKYHVL